MSRISRNISIILRAERLIAQRQVAVAAKRTGIYAAAGFAIGLAVVMLNIAGFFWLSATLTKPVAALILAGLNLVLAVLLALIANSMTASTDTTAAVELRDMALQDIEVEIKENLTEARNVVSGVRRDPIGALTPEIVSALLGSALKYARNRKTKAD
ncbi:phage holin family protein [Ruegeria lacuscaerulensis]|uniref:phage holin family protein n=1 Tax=Ruegeria lacuscaerulensis TaxID=55218 RepID=UPI001480F776|nr:phage holin family protein [Ruegeria lacuscaerulensis]